MNRYKLNRTMKLVGAQPICRINDNYSDEILELDAAINHGLTPEFFDILCLGYSIGLREAVKGGV